MELHVPPARPQQTYSQGYWHAVIAAILYALSAMGLMVNMLGYVLGHYPRQFELTDDQRNLILQTMMFFFWLAGGAAVFARVCGWSYVDSLYFCDVTVLTVGFGDFYAPNDAGRGLVFPFSVGGIIILGLMISSLSRFSSELGQDHIVKKHVEKKRSRTIDRSAPDSFQIVHKQGETFRAHQPTISGPIVLQNRTIAFHDDQKPFDGQNGQTCDHGDTQRPPSPRTNSNRTSRRSNSRLGRIRSGKPRFLLLHEEKDRFQAMREIQRSTQKFKRWYALGMSVTAFGILWCVGAVVFWQVEQRIQQLSYFEALYFCYVSLLTIGYGDLAPKSNAGKPFFVVWSLVAVPTMTILIGDLGDTVIASFKQGTFALADWTVLPKAGLWRGLLERNPWLLLWIQEKIEARAAKKRIDEGFRPPTDEEDDVTPTIDQLANVEDERETEHYLPQKLALAIKKTANDLKEDPPRRYSYEEWVVFTRLIRFSALKEGEVQEEEDEEGLVEWDWIGEDSPMMSVGSGGESSWVLDRLCESLNRYMRSQRRQAVKATNATPVVKVDGDSPDFSIEAS
ncbi:MAG: Potassium channel [Pycnora praestabilis]|nr:MAG: Potassium channel [Pycnora praestabilis]